MVRRHITVVVLALAAFAASACSNPTAPKCDQVSIGPQEQVSIGPQEQISIGPAQTCAR